MRLMYIFSEMEFGTNVSCRLYHNCTKGFLPHLSKSAFDLQQKFRDKNMTPLFGPGYQEFCVIS